MADPAPKKPPLVCPGHEAAVVKLCFSEDQGSADEDPFFLASASFDRSAMLRSGTSGDWVGTFSGHRAALWDVSLNADATKAVTGGADFQSKVWDATTGEELEARVFEHCVKVAQPHWQENKLVVAGHFGHVKLFELGGGNVPATQAVPSGRISAGAFVSAQQFVAAGKDQSGKDGAFLWDLRAQALQAIPLPHAGAVVDLEVRDSKLLLALPRHLLIYDISGPAPKLETEMAIDGTVVAASLSPAHKQVVTAEADCKLRCRDFQGAVLDTLHGHEQPVRAVRFAPNGDCASGAADSSVRLWSLQDRLKAA